MESKNGISRAAAAALRQKIQRASGLNQRVFDREIGRPAEMKILEILRKSEIAEVESEEESKKYVLPPRLNVEEHLFNLAFNIPGKPLRVIDHAFREYSSEYGYWQSVSEESLAQRVMSIAKKAHYPDTKTKLGKSLGTVQNVRKTLDHAGTVLFNNSLDASNTHLISFKNGTVCTKTGDLSPHNPDHCITSGLPYDYKKGALCPEPMQRYIASSFGIDNMEYIRAGLGCMLDLTAKDKFIHAIGPSGSGKGVLTRLIMKFFGRESVGSPNNFKLFANPDQVHQYLSGKRLVAIDDIVGFVGEEIGRFYTAVERTPMNARCLFKPKGYTQQFDIRYIVASTGQLPTKYSNSKGWERRVFPMPTIGKQDEDPNLETELENCIADIISWVLAQDKAERNRILDHPERYNDLAEEYFVEAAYSSSSAWGFIEECLKPDTPHYTDTVETQTVDIAHFYECYKAYCSATGRNSVSLDNLKHELKQALPANYIKRKNGGTTPNRFVYLKLAPFLFDKTEAGLVICDTSKLSHGGVSELKQWAKEWGSIHPYLPENIPTGTQNNQQPASSSHSQVGQGDVTTFSNDTQKEVSIDTKEASCAGHAGYAGLKASKNDVCVVAGQKSPEPHTQQISKKSGLHGLHGLHNGHEPINPEGLTVTQGASEEQRQFETDLIEANSIEALQEAKEKRDSKFRTFVMEQWKQDDRYRLLELKAQRLKDKTNQDNFEWF